IEAARPRPISNANSRLTFLRSQVASLLSASSTTLLFMAVLKICSIRDVIPSTMETWTERDVIEKLTEGWLLSGDVGADAPFGLINPAQTRADSVPSIE